MFVWELDGAIESWNVGAERLYGYSEPEAVGKLAHKLLAPLLPKPWDEILTDMRIVGSWGRRGAATLATDAKSSSRPNSID